MWLVTTDQNEALMRWIMQEEVEVVVKVLPSNKSPCPNGITIEFLKACWHFLGSEIVDPVEE